MKKLAGIKETGFLVLTTDHNLDENNIIRWDDVSYDNGNNFDATTGGYTVPVDGIYQFSLVMRMAGDWSAVLFLVDTLPVRYCLTRKSSTYTQVQTACTITIPLKAGQTIQTKTTVPGNLISRLPNYGYQSWFSGQLLFPQ